MVYITQRKFIENICPRPDHFCDGKHIPYLGMYKDSLGNTTFTTDSTNARDRGKCQYFRDGRCTHPKNPKNTQCGKQREKK